MLPIYTGGGLSSRIDQAKLAAEADEIEASWAADSAALAAAEAYIRLAQVRENLILLEQSLETVDAHVEYRQGLRRPGDAGSLRAPDGRGRNCREFRICLTEARGQAKVAEANLSFRLGADPHRHWELRKPCLIRSPSKRASIRGW